MSEQSEHRSQRLRKLSQLRENGVDPFPARVQRSHTVSDALAEFSSDEDAASVRVEVAGIEPDLH